MYGVGGFTFATPGTYLVRAVYQGAGHLATSNTLRVSVGFPTDKDADRFAVRLLHADGRPDHGARRFEVAVPRRPGWTPSPRRPTGSPRSRSASRRRGSWPGRSATTSTGREDGTMVRHHAADPKAALARHRRRRSRRTSRDGDGRKNLEYAKLVKLRAGFHTEAGSTGKAAAEVKTLADDLAKPGANANVVAQVRSLAPAPKARRRPRRRPPRRRPPRRPPRRRRRRRRRRPRKRTPKK